MRGVHTHVPAHIRTHGMYPHYMVQKVNILHPYTLYLHTYACMRVHFLSTPFRKNTHACFFRPYCMYVYFLLVVCTVCLLCSIPVDTRHARTGS